MIVTSIKQAESNGYKVMACVIVNPHNPLGKVLTVETIKEIVEVSDKWVLYQVVYFEIFVINWREIQQWLTEENN